MEDLDMNRDKNYNDRIVKFNMTDKNNGGKTFENIKNTFNKKDEGREDNNNEDFKKSERSRSPRLSKLKEKSKMFDKEYISDITNENSF